MWTSAARSSQPALEYPALGTNSKRTSGAHRNDVELLTVPSGASVARAPNQISLSLSLVAAVFTINQSAKLCLSFGVALKLAALVTFFHGCKQSLDCATAGSIFVALQLRRQTI